MLGKENANSDLTWTILRGFCVYILKSKMNCESKECTLQMDSTVQSYDMFTTY